MKHLPSLGILLCLFILRPCLAISQNWQLDSTFSRVELRIDTSVYNSDEHLLRVGGREYLQFSYQSEELIAELLLFPKRPMEVESMNLLPSPDYQVFDTLLLVGSSHYRARIQFAKLSQSPPPQILVQMILTRGDTVNALIDLFHTAEIEAMVPPGEHILYIGEENVFPLEVNLPLNIKPQQTWRELPGLAYKVLVKEGEASLHVIPLKYGRQTLSLPFQKRRPALYPGGLIDYQSSIEEFEIEVKRGKIQFLGLIDEPLYLPHRERYLEIDSRFPKQFSLTLNKPYRIETSEVGGSPLIATLYIQEVREDNQMRARIRVYDYHRRGDGSLYIKSQDEVLFLTNFDVLPPPQVNLVEIKKNNGDWSRDLSLKPGDKFSLRISGESLQQVAFDWEGLPVGDKVEKKATQERITWTGLSIPTNLIQKQIYLNKNGTHTEWKLTVEEYQRPRKLDFVVIEAEKGSAPITKIPSSLFFPTKGKDLRLTFLRDSIDADGRFFGPQYLEVSVEVWDKEQRLLEKKRTQSVCICPAESSPRRAAYEAPECFESTISINEILGTPLYELPAWAQVRVVVTHQRGKYQAEGQRSAFNVVIQKQVELDLEFSIPVGIIMRRFANPSNETLSTANFTAMMQIGLYEDNAVNQLRPIQLGVGVMAVDVFPFSGEAQRDLMLGSFVTFYPIKNRRQRWNVPLYLGGGYLVGQNTGLFFLGPGLSLRL
ncbi:MAG: hypothetical protein AAF804_00390 [Bacteroidota bacterium]